jgi:hypothetical protein
MQQFKYIVMSTVGFFLYVLVLPLIDAIDSCFFSEVGAHGAVGAATALLFSVCPVLCAPSMSSFAPSIPLLLFFCTSQLFTFSFATWHPLKYELIYYLFTFQKLLSIKISKE